MLFIKTWLSVFIWLFASLGIICPEEVSIARGQSTVITCPPDRPRLRIDSAKYRSIWRSRWLRFPRAGEPGCMDQDIGKTLDKYCRRKATGKSGQPMSCSVEVNDRATGSPCLKGPVQMTVQYTCQPPDPPGMMHVLHITSDAECSFLMFSLYCE